MKCQLGRCGIFVDTGIDDRGVVRAQSISPVMDHVVSKGRALWQLVTKHSAGDRLCLFVFAHAGADKDCFGWERGRWRKIAGRAIRLLRPSPKHFVDLAGDREPGDRLGMTAASEEYPKIPFFGHEVYAGKKFAFATVIGLA